MGGMTVHATQGESATGKVMLNLANKEFECGISYVGVTRVKSLENLSFTKVPAFKDRWAPIFEMKIFEMRLQHDIKEKASNDKYFHFKYRCPSIFKCSDFC